MRFSMLCAAVLACVGCKKQAAPDKADIAGPSEPNVEMINRGAEPRVPLRYQLAKGTTTSVEMTLDAEMWGRQSPTVAMTMEIVGEDVLPDGTMKVRSTIKSAEVRDRVGAPAMPGMKGQAEMMVGVAVTGTLSPEGKVIDAQVDLGDKPFPPEAKAQMGSLTQSFTKLAMIVPNEAVGVGATWRTRDTIKESGITQLSTTTVQIEKIEGTKVTFTRTSVISGADQTITQGSDSVTIKNISGQGSAHGTIELDHLVMTAEISDQYHSDVATNGQSDKMSASMNLKLTPK